MGLRDQDYGSREYTARDLDGNIWTFGTYDPTAALELDAERVAEEAHQRRAAPRRGRVAVEEVGRQGDVLAHRRVADEAPQPQVVGELVRPCRSSTARA